MTEAWVANASPLIALGNIGRLDLITCVGRRVLVPPAVVMEVQRGTSDELPAGLHLLEAVELVPSVAMWGLGAGETEVLSHAIRTPRTEAILDDLAARRCALAHGVSTRGTVGVVVLAKRSGLLPAAGPIFAALRRAGFHLSEGVVAAGLRAAGES